MRQTAFYIVNISRQTAKLLDLQQELQEILKWNLKFCSTWGTWGMDGVGSG
jgi:hypothetical protein